MVGPTVLSASSENSSVNLSSVSAFAPVNIAWIKYMGKKNGLPTNPSFSMTLEGVGTHTRLTRISDAAGLEFEWDEFAYVPPTSGRLKAEAFLKNEKIWQAGFLSLNYPLIFPTGRFKISTQNNVPAATGIATSASGFAALTLAWTGILMGDHFPVWCEKFETSEEARKVIADMARQGSGSACRSIEGPWVQWDPATGPKAENGLDASFIDFILLLQDEVKGVSSSEAHERVLSSPQFADRPARAQARMTQVMVALNHADYASLRHEVLEEALDMHDLFHTAKPPFTYLTSESQAWITRIKNGDVSLPSPNAILTLDAGANVHLFVPTAEGTAWNTYLKTSHPDLRFIQAGGGKGARYDESSI